jgi:hypothetical protein
VPVRADYRLTVVPEQPVAAQPAELGLTQHDLTLAGPLRQSAADEWTASFRLRLQEFATGAVFPRTAEAFPDELWNIRVGGSYRHRFESGCLPAIPRGAAAAGPAGPGAGPRGGRAPAGGHRRARGHPGLPRARPLSPVSPAGRRRPAPGRR